MGGTPCALQQPRQILGAADLDHLFHRLEIDPQIQRTGADHPANRSGLHGRLDGFAFAAINGAVMKSQGVLHLRTCETQALMPSLRLVAGVGEQQSAGVRVQTSHQFLVHAQSEMAGPWKSINALGKDAADLSCPCRGSAHDQWLIVVAQRMAGGLIEVADRGADGPGLQCWSLLPQPAQAELGLTAAFAAHQFMPFIQDHRVQTGEQLLRLGIAQQQRQRFRCGHQNLRR